MMTEAERDLVRAALKFAYFAAGEGFAPIDPDDAEDPADFLMRYTDATGDDDWETLHERFPPLLGSPS